MSSWKPEVEVSRRWETNDLRFTDRQQAMDYAEDLMRRWWSVSNIRTVADDRPATHIWVDGKLAPIKEEKDAQSF